MAHGEQAQESISPGCMRADRRRAWREALYVAAVSIAAVGAGILGLWLSFGSSIRENYQHYLIGMAEAAAQQIDPARHQAIQAAAQRDAAEYQRAVAPLQRMRLAVPDIRDLYTLVRDGSGLRLVLDAMDPNDHDGDGRDDRLGAWQTHAEAAAAIREALDRPGSAGHAVAAVVPYTSRRGSFVTGWAPIRDADGRQIGVVGVDVDARVYLAHLAAARRWALLGLVPAGLLIVVLVIAYWRLRMRSLLVARRAAEATVNVEQAALVLAREERRLNSLIDGTGVGTWEWDIASDVLIINERWAAMLGRRPGDLLPLTMQQWRAIVHPQDLGGVIAAARRSLAGPDVAFDIDCRMRHAAGHWVWIGCRGNVIERAADGRALRMAGIHVDVSVRKETELALQDSERKFRSLFELSPVGIALTDLRTGRFLQVNDALLAPTGYTREEILQLTHWDLTPPSSRSREPGPLASPDETGRYRTCEKEYVRKDGSRYPVLLSGICMTDAAGHEIIWSIVQDISQRKAMESELAAAARCDKLTGLANRTLFMERLQQVIERVRAGRQPSFAVLFLDFDHFKLINDALGHEAGDELLRQIAARLRTSLRVADDADGDTLICRFGGDEFLVLLKGLHAGADASRVAERLLNALAPVYVIHGREVHSSASIGIVTSEHNIESAEAVVRNADVAMYEAKRSGRACSVVFNEAMHTRLTRHMTIESGLRKALGTTQLSLVYQPIVELDTGTMVSAEALLRWQHPLLGPVSPTEFIPVAEDSGLIVALGQWVLQEACRTLVEWRRQDPAGAPATVSVNISRAELALGMRLLERVRETLQRTGLPAHCLQLEVTEREVMRDPAASLELMRQLQTLGVRMAMDDFGTGTSSLACLRDYPFDTIKIDRSFVHDLTANRDVLAVIHATITLVQNLGKSGVAEGVENEMQVAILQSLGCRYGQGYFFSRPLPASELLGALSDRVTARRQARAG